MYCFETGAVPDVKVKNIRGECNRSFASLAAGKKRVLRVISPL